MKPNVTSQSKRINCIQFLLAVLFLTGMNSYAQNVYSVLYESWETSVWEKQTQTLNTYDGSNYLTNSLTQSWVDPSWVNSFQTNYTNNPDGTAYQALSQSWDSGSSMWEDVQRTTYTYNAAKKVLTTTSESWFGFWQNTSKTTNTYDGSGYLTHTLNQTWDFILSNWKNQSQTNFTNNPNGTVNQSITQVWDITNTWVNNQRTTYTYTAANKVLTTTTETWTGSAWLNSQKETNTYNGSNYLTNSLSQTWSTGSSVWVNDSQSLYTNDGGGNPLQIVSQDWVVGTSSWVNAFRITFNYTLGVSDFFKEKGVVVYPNPSNERITVLLYNDFNSAYSITDQTGRIVQSGNLNTETTTLDISQMTSGIYFFRIGNKHTTSLKLIKN